MPEQMQNRLVWAEIPVTDMARAKSFYETVLGAPLKDEEGGPNPMSMLPCVDSQGAAGHIYPGKPATKGEGTTVHLAVADELPTIMERVKAGGGEVVSEVITIPVGSFFYAVDTEGNSVGFFKV